MAKTISILFAFAALGAGLRAAWLWYQSAQAKIDPAIHKMDDGRDAFRIMDWVKSVSDAAAATSALNAKAAVWTAAAVVAGALSTLFGAF